MTEASPDDRKAESKAYRRSLRDQRRERRRNSPGRYLFLGLALILLAVIFLLYRQHLVTNETMWKPLMVGFGAILIIIAIRDYFEPSLHSNRHFKLIAGIIILGNGLVFLLGFSDWWVGILALAGAGVIAISWYAQRETRKRAATQESLREQEVKYRLIVDNAASIIMEVDATSGKITYANKFARDFFGYTEEAVRQGALAGPAGLLSASGGGDGEILDDLVSHPENYLHNEKETLLPTGERAWILWTFKPILDEANNLKEVLCIGIDRTEQKKAEDQAAQQMKEKSAVEERTRLARDLHDAVSQTLFSASLIADVLPRMWERDREEGMKRLEEVRQLTRGSLAEMRTLLFELRPAALADAELTDLLRQLAEAVNGRARLPVTTEIKGTCEIPVDVKIGLYRIAQEALNNVARHSGATSGRVILECNPGEVTLHVIDNGRGFDVAQAGGSGFGLDNMGERAKQIGAILKVDSKVSEGTEVTVVWHDHARETKQ